MLGWFRRWRGRRKAQNGDDLRQRIIDAQRIRDEAQWDLDALREKLRRERERGRV